jgi:hypothetical protein
MKINRFNLTIRFISYLTKRKNVLRYYIIKNNRFLLPIIMMFYQNRFLNLLLC